MGISVFPVVEDYSENAFYGTAEWKWLTDCLGDEDLDVASKTLGVSRLDEFSSYSRQEAIEELGEADVIEKEEEADFHDGWFYYGEYKLWSPERQWFDPQEGLTTVRALLQYLHTEQERLEENGIDVEAYIWVLDELQKVLLEAQEHQKRFYLKAG